MKSHINNPKDHKGECPFRYGVANPCTCRVLPSEVIQTTSIINYKRYNDMIMREEC